MVRKLCPADTLIGRSSLRHSFFNGIFMERQLTEAARRALHNAARLAALAGVDAVEPMHLLWALVLDESQAAERMARHGVTREAIREGLPEAARGAGTGELSASESNALEHSSRLERVLREAGVCARRSVSVTEVGSEQLLWGLTTVPSPAATLLKQHGIAPDTIPADGAGAVVGEPLPVDFELTTQPFSRDSEALRRGARHCGDALLSEDSESRLDAAAARILDAAANRAREGLRVVEDFARFELDDVHLTRELKECRHELASALNEAGLGDWLAARDTPGDVGTRVSTPAESVRTSPLHVAQANFKRLQEALRSLEEYGKCVSPQLGRRCEAIRYRVYTLEKAVLGTAANRDRLANCRLYWLLTRDALKRKEEGGWRKAVQDALRSGVDVVQVREKEMPDAKLLDWARTVRRWTRETGTLLIMNDRPDLAVLCEADGVHVGQDELSVADVRRIVGPRMLVGVSTHEVEQARRAVLDGADYLGVGPVFRSGTKSFESLAGLDYVRQVAAEIALPWFAIGGIDESNVAAVLEAGATRIAVSGALSNADSPAAAAGSLRRKLGGTP
jgi:thiamine-phosphate pyrophosphorylase